MSYKGWAFSSLVLMFTSFVAALLTGSDVALLTMGLAAGMAVTFAWMGIFEHLEK